MVKLGTSLNQKRMHDNKCDACNQAQTKCICFSLFEPSSNSSASHHHEHHQHVSTSRRATYDSFLVFLALFFSLLLYLKGFSKLFLPSPVLVSYLIIKGNFFCLYDSTFICLLLKIFRFLVCHYKLIVFILIITFFAPFLKRSVFLLLIVLVLVYVLAKYLNHSSSNSTSGVSMMMTTMNKQKGDNNTQESLPSSPILTQNDDENLFDQKYFQNRQRSTKISNNKLSSLFNN
jgi:hypothetical protein